LRLPHGEQKPQDVILEILGYGIANAILATIIRLPPTMWTAWPTNIAQVLELCLTVFLLPIGLALVGAWAVEQLADVGFFVSAHPTAWDRLVLARLRKEPFFVLLTLRDGRKVGGAFLDHGYASNYPYHRDILIDQVWEIEQTTGAFVRLVSGEAGLYVLGKDILTLEIFGFQEVIDQAKLLEKENGEHVR
jgi:hypothetical protein